MEENKMANNNSKKKNVSKNLNNVSNVAVSLDKTDSTENRVVHWSPGDKKDKKTESSSGVKYIVVRGGLRVSEKEYSSNTDPHALSEMEFWQKIVNKWPDGSKVEIVEYDKKKHRVW